MSIRVAILMAGAFLIGCEVPEGEVIGEVGLVALSANALSANALSANALSANALSANALSANALLTSRDGVALTRYLVRCALGQGESLEIDVEGVTHRFDGLLGLAPHWRHTDLDGLSRERITACLLAHVNAFEVSVPISLRSGDRRAATILGADADELARYGVYEANFFGDLFATTPRMYTCWGTDPAAAASRSADRALRVCSDPASPAQQTTRCGFTSVGMCEDACRVTGAGTGAWSQCAGLDGTVYHASIGVWLRLD